MNCMCINLSYQTISNYLLSENLLQELLKKFEAAIETAVAAKTKEIMEI